jgi:hypothetical protein
MPRAPGGAPGFPGVGGGGSDGSDDAGDSAGDSDTGDDSAGADSPGGIDAPDVGGGGGGGGGGSDGPRSPGGSPSVPNVGGGGGDGGGDSDDGPRSPGGSPSVPNVGDEMPDDPAEEMPDNGDMTGDMPADPGGAGGPGPGFEAPDSGDQAAGGPEGPRTPSGEPSFPEARPGAADGATTPADDAQVGPGFGRPGEESVFAGDAAEPTQVDVPADERVSQDVLGELEQQTGADLQQEDVQRTDEGVRLTEQGREDVQFQTRPGADIPVVGAITGASTRARQRVDDVVDAGAERVQGLGPLAGSSALAVGAPRFGATDVRASGDVDAQLVQGVGDLGRLAAGAPTTVVGAGETAVEAGQFAAQNPREAPGAAVGAGQQFVRQQAEAIQEQPVRFGTSLVASGAVFSGAAAVGPRASLATRGAIQPVEEIVGIGGSRVTGAVSTRASRTLFPQDEPLIFSEEAAIMTAQAAGRGVRRGGAAARDLVRGEVDLPRSPRQADFSERFRLRPAAETQAPDPATTPQAESVTITQTEQTTPESQIAAEGIGDVDPRLLGIEGAGAPRAEFETERESQLEEEAPDASPVSDDQPLGVSGETAPEAPFVAGEAGRPPPDTDTADDVTTGPELADALFGEGESDTGGDLPLEGQVEQMVPPETETGPRIPRGQAEAALERLPDNVQELLGEERGQLSVGRQRRPTTETEPDETQPDVFTEFRNEVQQVEAEGRPTTDPELRGVSRQPTSRRSFEGERETETTREPVRIQPGLAEDQQPDVFTGTEPEIGERIGERGRQRPVAEPRGRGRPAEDTDTGIEVGQEIRQETETEQETEQETETELETEFGREPGREQELERELELETELESELRRELEVETGDPSDPRRRDDDLGDFGLASELFEFDVTEPGEVDEVIEQGLGDSG